MPRLLIRDIVDLQKEVDYIFDQLAPDLSGKRALMNFNTRERLALSH